MRYAATASVLLALLCVAVAVAASGRTGAKPCDKDRLRRAALQNIFGKIENVNSVTVSHGDHGAKDIARVQGQIDKYRKWAQGLPERCAREAYLGWMDYYQHKLDGAREELRTGAIRKHYEEYVRRSDAEDREAEELAPKLPQPPPRERP
jgi:hypothetical protein